MRKTVTSGKWPVASEPQAALLEPPALKSSYLEHPDSIAERRERLLRRQIDGFTDFRAPDYFDAAPPEPRWASPGLADWRAQQRSARRANLLLAVLLLGSLALIGLSVVAAELGWL